MGIYYLDVHIIFRCHMDIYIYYLDVHIHNYIHHEYASRMYGAVCVMMQLTESELP